jgi:pimeloyl-ACP methyl ester carboxylesterase
VETKVIESRYNWERLVASIPGFRPITETRIIHICGREITQITQSQATVIPAADIRANGVQQALLLALQALSAQVQRVYFHKEDSLTEQFVDSEAARLWTISAGSGVPTVLCNGGPGCCDYLAPVAAMLDDIAQVIRLEASGCGRSDPLPAYTVETCLTNLEAVRRHYGIERWIVGGHSAGADLALAYTLAYPERVLGFI